MNDSLAILGFTILVAALMAMSFALGRWERRTVYTPGPPAQDLQPLVDSFLTRVTNKELEALRKEMIGDGFTKLDPLSFVNIQMPDAEESVRLVPRYPSKPLPPPIADGWSSPAEKAYWLNLYGDPTKKKEQS